MKMNLEQLASALREAVAKRDEFDKKKQEREAEIRAMEEGHFGANNEVNRLLRAIRQAAWLGQSVDPDTMGEETFQK